MHKESIKVTSGELPEVRIPFVDLRSTESDAVAERVFARIKDIYQKSAFILGDSVEDFEQAFAELAGCKYAIGVNSGTDAILLSLRALGVGPGDEVITASNSFVASAGAIALTGAVPVFADVRDDHNLDPTSVEKKITKRTKAIVPVHLTGQCCEMSALLAIAKTHKLHVIEDAAQAIGAEYQNKRAGSFGDTGCFSLHPLKNLHVWGDGGVITTNSEALATRLKQERNHGLVNRNEVAFFSYNSRLDGLQAEVGLAAISGLSKTIERRRENAALYDEGLRGLSPYLKIPTAMPEAFHTYHLYVVTVEDREALQHFLRLHGVETKIHYPIPIHQQQAMSVFPKQELPNTERLSKGILSLPIRENLTQNEILEVCTLIQQFFSIKKPL